MIPGVLDQGLGTAGLSQMTVLLWVRCARIPSSKLVLELFEAKPGAQHRDAAPSSSAPQMLSSFKALVMPSSQGPREGKQPSWVAGKEARSETEQLQYSIEEHSTREAN